MTSPGRTTRPATGLPWLIAGLMILVLGSLTALHHRLGLWREDEHRAWEGSQRRQMRLVLHRVARSSRPTTYIPFLIRRCLARLDGGQDPGRAFRPLQAWSDHHLRVFFFDGAGRRLTLPGWPRDLGRVSERVLQAIRDAVPTWLSGCRSSSSAPWPSRREPEQSRRPPRN